MCVASSTCMYVYVCIHTYNLNHVLEAGYIRTLPNQEETHLVRLTI
jgi:hypothetical protein